MLSAFVLLPLVLVLGTLLVVRVARSRRELLHQPGRFRCRLRLVRGVQPGIPPRWQGRPLWALWAHDVLLVRLGRWPAATRALPVRFPETSVGSVSPRDVTRLGSAPVVLRLRLDAGDVVEVAAAAEARELLAGPFVVACLDGDSEAQGHRRPGW